MLPAVPYLETHGFAGTHWPGPFSVDRGEVLDFEEVAGLCCIIKVRIPIAPSQRGRGLAMAALSSRVSNPDGARNDDPSAAGTIKR